MKTSIQFDSLTVHVISTRFFIYFPSPSPQLNQKPKQFRSFSSEMLSHMQPSNWRCFFFISSWNKEFDKYFISNFQRWFLLKTILHQTENFSHIKLENVTPSRTSERAHDIHFLESFWFSINAFIHRVIKVFNHVKSALAEWKIRFLKARNHVDKQKLFDTHIHKKLIKITSKRVQFSQIITHWKRLNGFLILITD